MKIKSDIITSMPRPMPEGMFHPMPEVITAFEDGSTKRLFSFFPDEVSFQASEFIGLTEAEAHSLFQRKDTAYLRAGNDRFPATAPNRSRSKIAFRSCPSGRIWATTNSGASSSKHPTAAPASASKRSSRACSSNPRFRFSHCSKASRSAA